MRRTLLTYLCALLCALCAPAQEGAPKHEMRGAWVATVFNIDWPSTQGSSPEASEAQRREFLALLDTLERAGVNAVCLQVRPMADALYRSDREPWSQFLTGERGTAPAASWDPLAFAVEQAHARGMELHAWVNPFRLSKTLPLPDTEADRRALQKGWVLTHRPAAPKAKKGKKGKGKKGAAKSAKPQEAASIFDPGNPEARAHMVEVCRDIVSRYDVDGLLFDDYFYPDRLPEGGGYDWAEYQAFKASAKGADASLSQGDWRRRNVNSAIAEVYAMLQQTKPWVRFGVSPAGVGGGNGKATAPLGLLPPSAGSDWMYDRIYCDPLAWLAEGSVDYVSPQIYWRMNHETNPYATLARWWSGVAEALGTRPSFPSLSVVNMGRGDLGEVRAQVEATRQAACADQGGVILYSTSDLTGRRSSGLASPLGAAVFTHKALMPPMTWKVATDPGKLKKLRRKGAELTWQRYDTPEGMRYVVYAVPLEVKAVEALADDAVNFLPQYIAGITYTNSFTLPESLASGHWYAVAPYDRYGNEYHAETVK